MSINVERVTQSRVALAAGVSVPTVSKVLHGRDDVSDATRRRVEGAIAELGYEPSKGRESADAGNLVELVINRLDSDYSIEVMRGIIGLAADEGVEIVISAMNPKQASRADSLEWARRLRASGRKGVILVVSDVSSAQLDVLRRHDIAVVVIDALNTMRERTPTVGATNWAGGRAAADHLLALGHTRIAFIGGPEQAACNQERFHGYAAALMGRDIRPDPDLVSFGGFDTDTGARQLSALLALPSPPSAVFAANDAIAMGVIAEAHRRGLSVPDRLSVVGFDGGRTVEQTTPRLTSVAQPLQEMGRTALRTILRLSRHEPVESFHLELATRLVVRESTTRPSESAITSGS